MAKRTTTAETQTPTTDAPPPQGDVLEAILGALEARLDPAGD